MPAILRGSGAITNGMLEADIDSDEGKGNF
jgi:hypothetical protein